MVDFITTLEFVTFDAKDDYLETTTFWYVVANGADVNKYKYA